MARKATAGKETDQAICVPIPPELRRNVNEGFERIFKIIERRRRGGRQTKLEAEIKKLKDVLWAATFRGDE